MEDPSSKDDSPRVLRVLEALKQASHQLQAHPSPKSDELNSSSAINALLELETESDAILSKDPNLSTLSQHLSDLKALVDTLQKSHGLKSFLTRRVSTHSISRVAASIESEIQAWIDRECIETLTGVLREQQHPFDNEDELIKLLTQFEDRVSQGFNHELQDLVLKSKLFSLLESILCNPNSPKRIRERCAFAIAELIRFNKDVFVGQVLMGPTIGSDPSQRPTFSSICRILRYIKKFLAMNPDNGQPDDLQSPSVDFCDIEALFVKKFPAEGDGDIASVSQIPFEMFAYKLAEKDKTCMSIEDKCWVPASDAASISRDDNLSEVDDQLIPASDAGSIFFDEMSVCSEAPLKKNLTPKKRPDLKMRKNAPGTAKAQSPRSSQAQSPLRKCGHSLKTSRGSKTPLSPVHPSIGRRTPLAMSPAHPSIGKRALLTMSPVHPSMERNGSDSAVLQGPQLN